MYGHGYAQIFFRTKYIYIVYLVSMSKFDSSSHGSMMYSSRNDCLYLKWIYFVLVHSHDESHMDVNQSIDVL